MIPKRQYELFCELFPYLIPDVDKFYRSKLDGGIDLRMKDGQLLHFCFKKKNDWELRRLQ